MSKEQQKPEDYLRSLREGLNDIGQKVNKVIDDVFSGEVIVGEVRVAADEFETNDHFMIEIEIPGVKKEDINLQVVDGVLNITGKKTSGTSNDNLRYHKRERRFGDFSRSFPLPGFVELENIKAKFDYGVLTVSFPKTNPTSEGSTDINID